MVTVSSRFAVLATLCVVASVCYTPLSAGAAAVEARHSDKKVAEGFPAERDTRLSKQPVIPLPHKLSKTGVKDAAKPNAVEHGRTHKNKKDREEPVEQSVRLVQFPVRSAHSLYQRHHDEDDCPDKVVVNGDRDHVHLSCHHDHDHHDDHHDHHDHPEEVIVNGDRDHVRTRREDIQSRSPRHARPLLQRRDDINGAGSTSSGPIGTVEVQGRDPSNSQPIRYGEFFAENQGDHSEIKVSKTNHTSFRMVDAGSALQSNDSKDSRVFLEAITPESSDRLCCTYDANPSSSMPMRLDSCQGAGNGGDGHSSQRFSYDSVTGRIRLIWAGSSNQTSTQAPNSTVARRNDAQTGGGGGVDLIWLPSQNTTSRVEATSNGVQTRTVTVTVTASTTGVETGSISATSAAREASMTATNASTSPTLVSSISPSLDGSSPTQTAPASSDVGTVTLASSQTPTPATQSNGEASSSTPSELKIEVSPGEPSSTGPPTPSSASATSPDATPSDSLIATSSGASWGVPVRDGEVIDPVLQSRYVQAGMREF